MLSLHDSLKQINRGLARIREFRPLWKDEYSANPVLTPQEVASFEKKHSCRLPEGYREFLLQVGDGGAGPVWGLSRLGEHFSSYDHQEECFIDDVDLSLPFPHLEPWNDGDCPDDGAYFSEAHVAGSLMILDRGCALSARLVLNGPCRGEIWNDDRTDRKGIHPHLAPDGSRYQFLPWYLDWLARQVHQFGHKGNPNPDPGSGGAASPF